MSRLKAGHRYIHVATLARAWGPGARRPLERIATLSLLILCLGYASTAAAQDPDAEAGVAETADVEAAEVGSGVTLVDRQGQVSQRFQRLEELLLRLAEVEATENPERAALLRRAAKQSRETFILDRMSSATEALRVAQFQKAIDDQKSASENLTALLKLLLTEDRPQRIRDEKNRITNWIKDLKRQERRQRGTRARTENGADLEALEAEQQGIVEQAEALREEMAESNQAIETPASDADPKDADPEATDPEGTEPKDTEPKDGDSGQPSEPQDESAQAMKEALEKAEAAAKAAEEQRAEAEQKLAEAREQQEQAEAAGDAQQQQQAEQAAQQAQAAAEKANAAQQQAEENLKAAQQAQPSESPSQPADSPSQAAEETPPQSQTPQTPQQNAQQRLEQALEKMKQAEKDLEAAKRESATEKQRQAEEEIRQAIDQLEKILRQLREEEMQRELARLESRLRKMAQMQTEVLEKTRELAAFPLEDRDRQTDLRAGNLANQEKQIVLEADRAMLLLREEGSSVAFPEVVQQIRGDMQTVAERLSQTKIDVVTQGIQEDVLAALEEMIAALQQAQRDLEKQRQQQQQQQQQQQGPGEQPLVAALAELKLIRTMQTRVKGTTERYDTLLENSGDVVPAEIAELMQGLAERQNRLYTITRDLVLKRNQ